MGVVRKILGPKSKYDKSLPYTYMAESPVIEGDENLFSYYFADTICGLVEYLDKNDIKPEEVKLWRSLAYGEKRSTNRKTRKMGPKKVCATVIGSSIKYMHWKEPRYLSARETAILQGFPHHFRFAGSKNQVLTQIGKSIAVPIAKSLSSNIRKAILIIDQSRVLDGLFKESLKNAD